jgi:hypothetical protein
MDMEGGVAETGNKYHHGVEGTLTEASVVADSGMVSGCNSRPLTHSDGIVSLSYVVVCVVSFVQHKCF